MSTPLGDHPAPVFCVAWQAKTQGVETDNLLARCWRARTGSLDVQLRAASNEWAMNRLAMKNCHFAC
jgi:hypothetical protein